jgi:hypothetical protein
MFRTLSKHGTQQPRIVPNTELKRLNVLRSLSGFAFLMMRKHMGTLIWQVLNGHVNIHSPGVKSP